MKRKLIFILLNTTLVVFLNAQTDYAEKARLLLTQTQEVLYDVRTISYEAEKYQAGFFDFRDERVYVPAVQGRLTFQRVDQDTVLNGYMKAELMSATPNSGNQTFLYNGQRMFLIDYNKKTLSSRKPDPVGRLLRVSTQDLSDFFGELIAPEKIAPLINSKDIEYMGQAIVEGELCEIVFSTRINSIGSVSKYWIFIDRNFLPVKAIISEKDNHFGSITFSNMKVNEQVGDFSISVPDDFEAIEYQGFVNKESGSLVGKVLPQIEFEIVGDKDFAYENYRDRPVLLTFWASWCGPCIQELEVLKQLYSEYESQGLEIIAINAWDKPAKANSSWEQLGLPFKMAWSNEPTEKAMDLQGLPSTYLINKGRIVYYSKGLSEGWESELTQSLKENLRQK